MDRTLEDAICPAMGQLVFALILLGNFSFCCHSSPGRGPLRIHRRFHIPEAEEITNVDHKMILHRFRHDPLVVCVEDLKSRNFILRENCEAFIVL